MSPQEMLTHVVLHGDYHRGEAGRILAQISVMPPWDTFAVHLHRAEPSRRLQMSREPLGA
ncbi:DinB family protein [Mesorhizobium sp. M0296]|uniref:DinB family protein n=1 Tax=Mesorhizobium sp. M0296 TaxID=2956931 RepID=UPI003335CCB6